MRVIAYDKFPNDKGKEVAEYVSLDDLFAQSDFIFLGEDKVIECLFDFSVRHALSEAFFMSFVEKKHQIRGRIVFPSAVDNRADFFQVFPIIRPFTLPVPQALSAGCSYSHIYLPKKKL